LKNAGPFFLFFSGDSFCGMCLALERGMNTGFYNAAIQMATGSVRRMEAHSENLANSNMPGFKRLETSMTAFSDELDNHVPPTKDFEDQISVNHAQGALRATGRSLDMAIEGNGFFVVSQDNQDFYTRNGSFRVSPEGLVVNSLGMPLQTETGDLQVPFDTGSGEIQIDNEFNVRMDGTVLGTLKLAAVEDPSTLEQAGNTLFINKDAPEVATDCKVVTGFLEQSNTGVFEEMVGMMTTLRNYEACQRMLRTVDDMDDKMMSKLT
jgi:flagellar basal-body rod protein FlgF